MSTSPVVRATRLFVRLGFQRGLSVPGVLAAVSDRRGELRFDDGPARFRDVAEAS
jgi:hypothetical protein